MLNKISKDIRLVIQNFISLSALKVINTIVPFIALPYLISVIGFENYGMIVLGLSIITYLISFCMYGYGISGVRELATRIKSPLKMSVIVSNAISAQIVLLIIGTLLYLAIVFFTGLSNSLLLYLFFIPVLWGDSLFPSWYFQGVQKMKYVTFITAFVKILFTALVFILIKSENDFWMYSGILSAGSIISLISSFYIMYTHDIKMRLHFKRKKIIEELKNNFVVFLDNITPMLYNNTTQVVMGIVLPIGSLGVFDAIRKIVIIVSVFCSALSVSIFPYFNRNIEKFKQYNKYLILICLLVIIVVFLVHPVLLNLFSIERNKINTITLILLLIGQFGAAISMIFGTNYLIVMRKEKRVLTATTIASLIGFTITIPLIYFCGLLGGAMTIMISQVILGSLIYYFYKINK